MPDRPVTQRTRSLFPSWAGQGAGVKRLRRQQMILSSIILVVLVVAGLWVGDAVRESLTVVISRDLVSLRESRINAFRLWQRAEANNVENLANIAQVRAAALSLAARHEAGRLPDRDLRASEEVATIRRTLEPVLADEPVPEESGFAIVHRSGRVLAARADVGIGETVSLDATPGLRIALGGKATVLDRFEDSRFWRPGSGRPTKGELLFGLAAPIATDDHRVPCVMLWRIPVDTVCREVFNIEDRQDATVTFGFDRDARLATEYRFVEQLKRLGLVPDQAGATSIRRVQMRDPGRDLRKGKLPVAQEADWPLTRLAAEALEAARSGKDAQGVIVTPYRDFRGVEVVGAWRWLPDIGYGVAVEMPARGAFLPLRPIRRAVWWLFALAVVVVLLGFGRQYVLSSRLHEIRKLGQYRLERKLGEGGMGVVYLAKHAVLRRPTAVKVLGADAGPEAVARFEREVQLTARLSHPNTIEIFDYGRTPEGLFYYAMEYIEGPTLADLLSEEERIPVARTIHLLGQVCRSLREAHRQGLIHRDIKPQNIMICERGGEHDVVKVLDFGLVKPIQAEPGEFVTRAETIQGSPSYIAPERLRDPSMADPRTDIYSVGSVAFNLVTGRAIFEGSAMEICSRTLTEDVPDPRGFEGVQIPDELADLIVSSLARDPDARPRNMDEFLRRLERIHVEPAWTQADAAACYASWREATRAASVP